MQLDGTWAAAAGGGGGPFRITGPFLLRFSGPVVAVRVVWSLLTASGSNRTFQIGHKLREIRRRTTVALRIQRLLATANCTLAVGATRGRIGVIQRL